MERRGALIHATRRHIQSDLLTYPDWCKKGTDLTEWLAFDV